MPQNRAWKMKTYAVESEGKTRIITAEDIKGAAEFARLIFPNASRKVREATEEEKQQMLGVTERVLAGIVKKGKTND